MPTLVVGMMEWGENIAMPTASVGMAPGETGTRSDDCAGERFGDAGASGDCVPAPERGNE
ncbi:MAG: hypothetical protein IT426_01780 [Pirellulales bacterium]|nr:hypothetical protein [Pirellulales bacterium]